MKKTLSALLFLMFGVSLASAAAPDEVNRLAGASLFGKGELWQEAPEAVGKRLRLKFRTDGGGDSRVLSAATAGREFFGTPSSEVRIFSSGGRVSRIDLVLFNKGDNFTKKARKGAFRKELAKHRARLERLLREGLGRGRKAYFGSGKLSRQMPMWDIEGSGLILDSVDGEYLMLHIVPPEALGEHRRRVTGEQRAGALDEYAANVVRGDNGDVCIGRVPMVDQGQKGYCVPATVERIARYFGISDIDMHKLASKFHTAGGGGTSVEGTVRGTRKLLGEYGLRMREATKLRRQTLIRYVDQGIPVLWFHFSTPDFKQLIDESLASRADTPFDEWVSGIHSRPKLKKGVSGAHVALIIGYNQRSGEFAVSNSWGERYAVAWVRFADMEQVDSRLNLYVVIPRR